MIHTTTRRGLLAGAATLPALAAFPGATARAQGAPRYGNPSMFIPAAPGGGWDGLGRAIEQVARAAGLVGSMQFENVGGAGGAVGLPRFVGQRRGRPDALMVAGAVMVGSTITNKSPVGIKDVTPIAKLTDEASVIVVPANSDIRDIKGLMDALKAGPRAVSVGGGSAGGIDHILLGLLIKSVGGNAREASYVGFAGGGPAQAAILGGQVKAGISGLSEFAEQIKAGRMRALATTSEQRIDPNIPTLKESGIDIVLGNWRGLFAPPGISQQVRETHQRFAADLHALPAWKELLKTREWDDAYVDGPAFEEFLKKDVESTTAVLKDIGLA
ncbi:Bug family tripartite tricarboxylate transporter substrate binding protein [Pararoseomonas indoligenes]|uniref:Tripartite tricarboxylate transporter substrate binding protein n=1 Tax=Roseomonas indoligenes TaxID=2820811 RepID=A0A940N3Z9_9PROT|nr:tripartite tricarboxylate transporter substrate-binding protein [Pararoseomonas indoligenes]MBP0493792.1 tripartite tricarboxylate transporter substrate binding protein [Pararoseomonas indoligenes]